MCENEDLLMQIETLEQTFSRMEMSIIDLKANQRRELTTKVIVKDKILKMGFLQLFFNF